MIKESLVRELKFCSSTINPWLVAVRLGIDVGCLAVRSPVFPLKIKGSWFESRQGH